MALSTAAKDLLKIIKQNNGVYIVEPPTKNGDPTVYNAALELEATGKVYWHNIYTLHQADWRDQVIFHLENFVEYVREKFAR